MSTMDESSTYPTSMHFTIFGSPHGYQIVAKIGRKSCTIRRVNRERQVGKVEDRGQEEERQGPKKEEEGTTRAQGTAKASRFLA